jgi:hypothetical protein
MAVPQQQQLQQQLDCVCLIITIMTATTTTTAPCIYLDATPCRHKCVLLHLHNSYNKHVIIILAMRLVVVQEALERGDDMEVTNSLGHTPL